VGLLNEELFQHFLSASIFTMIISPPLIAYAPAVAERTQEFLTFTMTASEKSGSKAPPMADHVIIAGYGVNGQNLARVLREAGIPYLVLEIDGEKVGWLQQERHPVVFGDVTRKEILLGCSVRNARTMVFAISDPQATRTAVRLARSLNPHLHLVVRTRHLIDVDELAQLGANEVIPEEFETSIEIFTRVLEHYHIPRNVINAQIQVIRDENYSMLRGLPQTIKALDRVGQLLTAGTSDTLLVTDSCLAANKSLDELDISGRTGASLIAVVRNEKPFLMPPPDFRIQPGDILVLVGNHENMDKAFEYLAESPSPHKRSPNEAEQEST
ncbi:MAG: NAD-binding protein, partial [Bacteroidota bacterium]